MPIMPELGRLKQEYYKTFKATLRYIHEFQGSLDYIVRTRLKLRKKNSVCCGSNCNKCSLKFQLGLLVTYLGKLSAFFKIQISPL